MVLDNASVHLMPLTPFADIAIATTRIVRYTPTTLQTFPNSIVKWISGVAQAQAYRQGHWNIPNNKSSGIRYAYISSLYVFTPLCMFCLFIFMPPRGQGLGNVWCRLPILKILGLTPKHGLLVSFVWISSYRITVLHSTSTFILTPWYEFKKL